MMQSSTKRAARQPDSFLEALRGLSQDTASEAKIQIQKAVTEDIPQMFGLKGSGDLKAGQQFSLADLEQAEKQGEKKAERRFENRLTQERTIFIQAEAQTKQQIITIQEEIKMMAKSVGDLGKEVQLATMQSVVNPGTYHRNFFETLKSLIKNLRMKVTESRNWLAQSNARAGKRKGFYWNQAQKSGTKFMLSSERYMVTTTG